MTSKFLFATKRLSGSCMRRSFSFSPFANITSVEPDPILRSAFEFVKDPAEKKVFLAIGAHRTEDGKPYLFNCVKRAEKIYFANPQRNHEYLPQSGDEKFRELMKRVMFGENSPLLSRVATVQSFSGTGALCLASHFLGRFLSTIQEGHRPTVYVSTPNYPNHPPIINDGGMECKTYRYFNAQNKQLDFEGLMEDIERAPNNSVILLQGCGHNPTATDPTPEQWKEIALLLQRKQHVAWFDAAYQGFVSGNLDEDAAPIRMFAEMGLPLFACQSLSKNMGLYGQRVGAVHIVCPKDKNPEDIVSRINQISRGLYSMPGRFGSEVAAIVMSTPSLKAEWHSELMSITNRFRKNRQLLRSELEQLGTPGDWSILTTQRGMFSYLYLTTKQCQKLVQKHHVYLVNGGRICYSGLTEKNVAYVAQALDDVVRNPE
eukprot:TRINITY_DN6194_c0_g1_i1.p1 TRINITY_DN6194_c0_g1~~TRINITY_DN6194_c0_g1_i1.p1  ORF type:complete len:448 (-),score=93.01 TRINITY_DN6194_c0_g1_i1:251-1543(-)